MVPARRAYTTIVRQPGGGCAMGCPSTASVSATPLAVGDKLPTLAGDVRDELELRPWA